MPRSFSPGPQPVELKTRTRPTTRIAKLERRHAWFMGQALRDEMRESRWWRYKPAGNVSVSRRNAAVAIRFQRHRHSVGEFSPTECGVGHQIILPVVGQ